MLIGKETMCGSLIEDLTKGSMKKVKLLCDGEGCDHVTVTTYANYCQGQRKRSWSGHTFCKSCTGRRQGKKNKGSKHPPVKRPERTGNKHPSWKGGRYISHDGYVVVSVRSGRNPNRSGWGNYRKEHLVVMEEHLGRKLTRGEVVHHIDGDKQNNKLSNLYLTDQKGHRNAHQTLQEIGYMLIKAGLISFDHNTGSYKAHHKPRELLGHLGTGNQQPSEGGNPLEGSETRSHDPNTEGVGYEDPRARGTQKGDDIVRSTPIIRTRRKRRI